MKGYQAIYVCRLCGEKYGGSFTINKHLAIETITCACSGKPNKEPMAPWLNEIHLCEDGSMGVGDFQGYQYKED